MTRANTLSLGSGLPRGTFACAMLFLAALPAFAQNAQPAPPAPAPPPAYQPGMLDSIGRWFKDSYHYVSGNVEGARNTMSGIGERAGSAAKDAASAATSAASNAATAAKDAATGAISIPGRRVVNGKERCDTAPNGAPDCRHAAEAVCRAKGFSAGSSLDIQTTKDCPTEAYIRRETRECKVASFVVRAVCQ